MDLNSGIPVTDLDKKIEEGVESKVKSQAEAAFAKARELNLDIMGLSKWFLVQTGEAPKNLKDYILITQAKAEVIHGVAGGSMQ